MLAILIIASVLSIGLLWMIVALVAQIITGKKYSDTWSFPVVIGAIFLAFTFMIQAANRCKCRAELVKFEATRKTIMAMPKDKSENSGIYRTIVEKNEWLATEQTENKWFWVGDLSVDDAVDNTEPLAIDEN